MRRVYEAGLGQREHLLAHRAVERARVALLEIGAPAAADEQRVAGERHRAVVEHVRHAAVGVPRGRARLERAAAERDAIAVREQPVRALGAGRRGERDAAAQPLLVQPRAGDVVRVHVRLERPGELQAELRHQRRVASRLLEHRVDQHRLARARVREQVGVGRGLRIEELAKDHYQPAMRGVGIQAYSALQFVTTPVAKPAGRPTAGAAL